jgi:SAM-dependent methyltransferase
MANQVVDIAKAAADLAGTERLLFITPGPHGTAILPSLLRNFAQYPHTLLDSDRRRFTALEENGNCRRVLGRATVMPFRRHSFDVIFSFEALYSIRPPWTVLAEFHRVLVPDGKLIFIEPSAHGFFSALRDKISGPGKRIFSIDELKFRLARGDWDVKQVDQSPAVADLPKPFYCVQAIKKENPAEPVPQYLTARDLMERRKKKIPQGEELP